MKNKKTFIIAGMTIVLIIVILLLVFCGKSKQFTINLIGNPTMGYSWTYTPSVEGVLEETSQKYILDASEETTDGAGGIYSFAFKGLKEGKVVLTFVYSQVYDTGEAPKYKINYEIQVDENCHVTLLNMDGKYFEETLPEPIFK